MLGASGLGVRFDIQYSVLRDQTSELITRV